MCPNEAVGIVARVLRSSFIVHNVVEQVEQVSEVVCCMYVDQVAKRVQRKIWIARDVGRRASPSRGVWSIYIAPLVAHPNIENPPHLCIPLRLCWSGVPRAGGPILNIVDER